MTTHHGTVLFAGGGTGGHLFPSLAVAEQLAGRCEVHFACADKPLDTAILTKAGVSFTALPAVGLSGNPLHWFGFVHRYRQSERLAGQVIDQQRVSVVVSMGGYVSAPVVSAAARRKGPWGSGQLRFSRGAKISGAGVSSGAEIPGVSVLLVNLDAVAGKANRRMARKADRVYSVFEKAGMGVSFSHIGFPLRRAAIGPDDAGEARRQLHLDPTTATLLITGASQGAQTLNKLMIELAHCPLWSGWQILHLAGEGNTEALIQTYQQHDIKAKVLPFLDAMGLAWAAADVAISRCGAGCASEALANAVPTIFFPYPYHRDQHQRFNVKQMAEAGGCVVLPDLIDPVGNAAAVEPVLRELMADADRRKLMRESLVKLKRPNGAEALAQAVLSILSEK